MNTLTLTKQRQTLTWLGQTLSYSKSIELVLLALVYRHREDDLTLENLERYALLTGIQLSSLRTELYEFLHQVVQLWPEHSPIVLTMRGRERGYRLSAEVTQVCCDLSDTELEQLLSNQEQPTSVPMMLALLEAETEFEHGRYDIARRCLHKVTGLVAPEQEVARQCLLNWLALRTESDGQTMRRHTRAFLEWFEQFDIPQRGLSDLVRARVLIQAARTPMTYQQRREARRLYLKAAKLLPTDAYKERSSVEAGLGYVETRAGGSLSAAQYHYQEALKYATLARWPWSVQVQQGNLADLLCEQYKLIPEQPSQHPLLTQAKQLLLESQDICDRFGFRGSGDTELYRARIAIWQKDRKLAWELIMAAFKNLDSAEAEYDYTFGWEMKGEWYLAFDEVSKGLSNLRYAAQLEEKFRTGKDALRLRTRVQQLEKHLRLAGVTDL